MMKNEIAITMMHARSALMMTIAMIMGVTTSVLPAATNADELLLVDVAVGAALTSVLDDVVAGMVVVVGVGMGVAVGVGVGVERPPIQLLLSGDNWLPSGHWWTALLLHDVPLHFHVEPPMGAAPDFVQGATWVPAPSRVAPVLDVVMLVVQAPSE